MSSWTTSTTPRILPLLLHDLRVDELVAVHPPREVQVFVAYFTKKITEGRRDRQFKIPT